MTTDQAILNAPLNEFTEVDDQDILSAPLDEFENPQREEILNAPLGEFQDAGDKPKIIYRQETRSIVESPSSTSPREFEYLDNVQNRGKKDGDHFGFTDTGDTEGDVIKYFVAPVKGAVASGVDIKTALEAGGLRQRGEALREVARPKPFDQMTDEEKLDAIARNNTPALATFLFGSMRDRTLATGWISRLFRNEEEIEAQATDLIQASNKIRERSKVFLKDAGLERQEGAEGFLFDVGGVTTTVGASLGLAFLTKNPASSAGLFREIQKNKIYLEAQDKGWDNIDADKISTFAGNTEALLEFVGVHQFLKASRMDKPLNRIGYRMFVEATQEGSQTAAEEFVAQTSGLREKDIKSTVQDVFYSMILGAIAGGGSAGIAEVGRSVSEKKGAPWVPVDQMAQKIEDNFDEIERELTRMVKEESSPLKIDKQGAPKAKKILSDFIQGKEIDINQLDENDKRRLESLEQKEDEDFRDLQQRMTEQQRIEGVPQEQSQQLIEDFLEGREVDISAYDQAQQEEIQKTLERAMPVRDTIIKGRIAKLDDDIEGLLTRIDATEQELAIARAEGRGTKRLEQRLQKMAQQWQELDAQRGELMTVVDPEAESADLLQEQITVEGKTLEKQAEKATKQSVQAVNRAFRAARSATKKDIKSIQKDLASAIRKSGLNKQEQADFINTITEIQTREKLQNQIPKIQVRIENKLNKRRRKDLISNIKKTAKQARKSNVIAVDFANQIQELFREIDTTKRTDKTINQLQSTLDFMQKNPSAAMPKDVLNKLEILNKKPINEVSINELEAIAARMEQLVEQGKAKFKLMEKQRERRKQKRLAELREETVPIDSRPLKNQPIGTKISIYDKVKNTFIDRRNALSRLNINKSPMDVIFDIFDGSKDYKGANHRIFKQTIDDAWTRYQNLRHRTTRDVKALDDKLKLKKEQYDKIGAYAVAQQEGGIDKLVETGYSRQEIENLQLTEDEMQMYTLMREKLDELRPMIREVMRTVYNKDFAEEADYFPFMTDFDKTHQLEIQDMLGPDVPTIQIKKKNVEQKFTKKRTLGKQKVRIDAMGVFLKHVDNASYLVEAGRDIKELSELAKTEDYANIAGDVGQEIAVDWLDILARKGNAPGRDAWLDTIRHNVGAAMLGYKLSTVMIQPTALADGSALVGGGYVMRGAEKVATNRDWRIFLMENMPEIRERVGDDPAYADFDGDTVVGKAREAGYWALKNVDLLTASSVAAGAYMRSVEQRGGQVDLSNPDPIAIAEAQLYMRRTQASAFAKDAPPIISQGKLTGNPSLDRLILQFQTFILNRWSIIEHDMVRAGIRGKTKQSLNAAMFLILANFAELGLRRLSKELMTLIANGELEPWEETVEEEAVRTLVGNVPFVGSVVNGLEYGSVPVPAVSLTQNIFDRASWALTSDDASKRSKHTISAVMLTSGLFGVPGVIQGEQIARDLLKDVDADGLDLDLGGFEGSGKLKLDLD